MCPFAFQIGDKRLRADHFLCEAVGFSATFLGSHPRSHSQTKKAMARGSVELYLCQNYFSFNSLAGTLMPNQVNCSHSCLTLYRSRDVICSSTARKYPVSCWGPSPLSWPLSQMGRCALVLGLDRSCITGLAES